MDDLGLRLEEWRQIGPTRETQQRLVVFVCDHIAECDREKGSFL